MLKQTDTTDNIRFLPMPCYLQPATPPSRENYALWLKEGYRGTWEQYLAAKANSAGQTMFVCGDLGPHCAQCAAASEVLCDYPVGEGLTCDRSLCQTHAVTVGEDLHYCSAHHAMWAAYRDKEN